MGEREEERLCNVCLCQEVEDERHFLLACPMYVRQRVEMFDRIREKCKLDYVEQMEEEWQLNVLKNRYRMEEERQRNTRGSCEIH